MSSKNSASRSKDYVACMQRHNCASYGRRRLNPGDIGFCAKDCIKAGGGVSVVKACEARCQPLGRRMEGGIGYCAKDCIIAGGGVSAIRACEARCPPLGRRMEGDIGFCQKACIRDGGGVSAIRACSA